ncbi:MAG: UbiA family prenyltransferase [Candidatus Scalindua rubra]|nr:UbiA family prenyltransferase [Candidatus Scalindua rubra]TWU31064.1 prenyltransferase [Candidatus Brocadiaceae bacterium S225]
MQAALKPTQHSSGRILERNTSLPKGLNLYNVLILMRLEAYMPICFFCTMAGLQIAGGAHSLQSLLIIGLANTFVMAAACTFNDAEDATEDMLVRSTRNIIALKRISKSTGYILAGGFGIIGISLSIIAGVTVFMVISAFIVTTFLYSWRSVRMKAMPFWDLLTHAIMGGLMFLSSAWSSGILLERHVMQICLIFSLGIVLALLAHQLYDYKNDLTTNVRTSTIVLGKRKTYYITICLYILITYLLSEECLSGFFPFVLILSFCAVAGSMIIMSIILYPKQAFYVSKRMIPWAVNTGAIAAIFMWYISK